MYCDMSKIVMSERAFMRNKNISRAAPKERETFRFQCQY